jgi:hypothetical protein
LRGPGQGAAPDRVVRAESNERSGEFERAELDRDEAQHAVLRHDEAEDIEVGHREVRTAEELAPGDHIVADTEVKDGDGADSREDVAAVGFIVEERDRLCGRRPGHAADNRNRLEQ